MNKKMIKYAALAFGLLIFNNNHLFCDVPVNIPGAESLDVSPQTMAGDWITADDWYTNASATSTSAQTTEDPVDPAWQDYD